MGRRRAGFALDLALLALFALLAVARDIPLLLMAGALLIMIVNLAEEHWCQH